MVFKKRHEYANYEPKNSVHLGKALDLEEIEIDGILIVVAHRYFQYTGSS